MAGVTSLRVQGVCLTNRSGPIALRGMSLFWSQWGARFFTRETLAWLKTDWGANLVRVPMGVEPDGYLDHPDEELRKLEAVVSAAIALDLYVIIDWHSHAPHLDAATSFFRRVGRRYRDAPNVIFELWNEPGPEYEWRRDIQPYHQAVLRGLRAEAPENLVILGTEFYSQRVDHVAALPVDDKNACYALHFYTASHGEELREKAEAALRAGVPLFASEWGLSESTGDGALDLAEAERWWRFLEGRGISDAGWSIFDKAESSAALRSGMPAAAWSLDGLTASGTAMRRRLRALSQAPTRMTGERRVL
ncbi:MAG TPA: glycoside hydrolase family 5 protein [Caulobacter sp.]|nr:glycoside hydrolase family 5 protein [Caulobacter sp.]